MEFLKISEVAKAWNLSERGVQSLCAKGKIEGAMRFGRSWMIPKTATKPIDKRTKAGKDFASENMPMPRKSPFLGMTDLYTKAGSADEVIKSLAYNPEAQALFSAEIAYSRGEIDSTIKHANEFLRSRSGFYAVNAGGMLLALASMWKGDITLYRQAKVHICEAPWKSAEDKQIMQLSLACIDSAVRDISIEG